MDRLMSEVSMEVESASEMSHCEIVKGWKNVILSSKGGKEF